MPVRNEEATLPAFLASLDAQMIDQNCCTICFYLDGCRDGSEALLRSASKNCRFPLHLETGSLRTEPNAGRARRKALSIAMARNAETDGAFFLTTDADSVPYPDWVMASVDGLTNADVVTGTLLRSEAHEFQSRVERYYDRIHRYRRAVDPVGWESGEGRHFTSAANMAIRASTYRMLGGFRDLVVGEDAALVDDASRAGFRVRRDPAMIVETSSRRDGRAVGGFAAALTKLDQSGLPEVAHPAAAAWQYRAQARARLVFTSLTHDRADRKWLGQFLGLSNDHILRVVRDCPNAEAFAMRVVPSAPQGNRLVPLPEAEVALSILEREIWWKMQ